MSLTPPYSLTHSIVAFALGVHASAVIFAAEQTLPNTQPETIPLMAPASALESWTVPKGFSVSQFAAEPEIRQPIGMTFDARGRLWVCENYTYAENPKNFDTTLRDRIVILEDADGDGRAEKRTVFWDKGSKLTSVAVGFGGTFVLCAPQMLFIPDRNGDDIPDGEPEVLLDGFDDGAVRHNIVNGLKWGPDGWIYGRHGIQATSMVGKPGAAEKERVALNCGIWRFHPVTRQFEVVYRGTVNSWGHDWDEHGQLFFINTVIGHLWHVVPGGFARRMYGEHFRPHLYELLEQTADHVHWDTKEKWDEIRAGISDTTAAAGGGHAHSGFMIYLGGSWPAEYRNRAFTINYHGRRLNQDALVRQGATYVGQHRPDFGGTTDPWFRGVEVDYGPDGSVYVLDWSDIGECHDNDGIHRTSGRIYKIRHEGKQTAGAFKNLAGMSATELANLQTHENEWFARQAGRLLHERSVAGSDMDGAHATLRRIFENEDALPHKLRAMWRLGVTGGASVDWLRERLNDPNEHVRVWALQFLMQKEQLSNAATANQPAAPLSTDLVGLFTKLAEREKSGLVLSFLTSALRHAAPGDAWPLATAIARHGEFATDPNLPLLLWHALEPAVSANPEQAIKFVATSAFPKTRAFVARRLTSDLEKSPEPVNALVEALPNLVGNAQADVLSGMSEAMRGWRKAEAPKSWASAVGKLAVNEDPVLARLVRNLGVVFGDGMAADELKAVVIDQAAPVGARRQAIQSLSQTRAEGLVQLVQPYLTDRDLGAVTVRALGSSGAPGTPELILKEYKNLRSQDAKVEAISALASRAATAPLLLAALEKKSIPRADVTAFQLQQLRSLNDEAIDKRVAALWPELRARSADKRQQIETMKARLTPERLSKGDAARGRELYIVSCGACHKLYDYGGDVGPDLTGSDRKNLAYLLDNVVDPSGIVPEGHRASTVSMKDGRTLTGVATAVNDRTLVLQTPTEKMTLDRKEVESIEQSELSLMPEGLFDAMEEKDVVDMLAYLMSEQPPK